MKREVSKKTFVIIVLIALIIISIPVIYIFVLEPRLYIIVREEPPMVKIFPNTYISSTIRINKITRRGTYYVRLYSYHPGFEDSEEESKVELSKEEMGKLNDIISNAVKTVSSNALKTDDYQYYLKFNGKTYVITRKIYNDIKDIVNNK